MRAKQRHRDRGLERNESHGSVYVSRCCEDLYECVAYNGIGTEAQSVMRVTVQRKYPGARTCTSA